MAESGENRRTSSCLLVVAFDFGTTYSGYAFSFKSDPLRIIANNSWIAGSERLISLKTPTCVLINPHHQFDSFGYEAENKYAALAFERKHQSWLFFRHFKMLLYHNKKLARDTIIEDIKGTPMPAMTIFAMALRYLRENFLQELHKQVIGVEETDIQYVLTVPAIWDDNAKQFMREAAILAGFDTKRLRLALEPEAASIWCQIITDKAVTPLTKTGTQYMVIDLGGGTVDITVHGKNSDGTLSELHRSSGGPWGGTNVDRCYMQWLEKIYGKRAVDRFKTEDEEMSDYFDLLREFETNKRLIKCGQTESVILKISATLRELSEKEEGQNISKRIASLKFDNDVVIRRDKMKISPSVVQKWFEEPVKKTVSLVQSILSETNMKDVETVLLVGGFAESKFVQDRLKSAVTDKRFIVPDDAGLAVLKGAVRFGHEPYLVSTRIISCSYGINTTRDYDVSNDHSSLPKLIDGKLRVKNVFEKFVSAGETVALGQKVAKTFVPTCMERAVLGVFRSENPCPKFITDPSCETLGKLVILHPEGETLEDKKAEVIFIFGDTELKVHVRIIKTGKEYESSMDCL